LIKHKKYVKDVQQNDEIITLKKILYDLLNDEETDQKIDDSQILTDYDYPLNTHFSETTRKDLLALISSKIKPMDTKMTTSFSNESSADITMDQAPVGITEGEEDKRYFISNALEAKNCCSSLSKIQ
jgi:hypothetical protein